MQQPIVKTFLQFVNENVEQPQLDTSKFLIELADLMRASEKFGTVSVEGTYIEITRNENIYDCEDMNIHDRKDIRDATGDSIRVYADYEAKLMPLFKEQLDMGIDEINALTQHGIIDLSTFLRGFAISATLECWSKDLEGWMMDDGIDEMEEESLADFDIPEESSIQTIAEKLVESVDDRFDQFYLAGDAIQDSVDDYCNQYSDEDEEPDED